MQRETLSTHIRKLIHEREARVLTPPKTPARKSTKPKGLPKVLSAIVAELSPEKKRELERLFGVSLKGGQV